MEQEKILLQIESELVALRTFIRKLKHDAKLHQLDIDLIKQKARSMYDSVLMLEPTSEAVPKATVFDIKKPEPAKVPDEELDDSMESEKERLKKNMPAVEAEVIMTSEEEIMHDAPEEPVQAEEPVQVSKNEPEKEPEIIVTEEKTEIVEFEIEEPVIEPEVKTEPVIPPTPPRDEVKQEIKPQVNPTPKPEPEPQVDLFSTAPETVADKLSSSGKQTLADKLSQSTLKSLRQFIGINEKFLFINELFNGDMSRYNSAIDELDSMPTLKGANTYLFELKVQNMWDEEMDAYTKISELLEMKFSL